MLTKTDLDSISKIVSKKVREEVEAEGRNIRDNVKSDLFETKARIVTAVGELSDRVKNVEVRLNSVDGRLESVETKIVKGFRKLDKKFEDLFDFLDKDVMKNQRRIHRIEEHLGFPES